MATMLEQSACYAVGAVGGIGPAALSRPTPCARWDLRALLEHVNESLAALHEGMTGGRVDLIGPGAFEDGAFEDNAFQDSAHEGGRDPVPVFLDRVGLLVGVCAGADCRTPVAIADRSVPVGLMTALASIEIAVHGWDVSQARGQCLAVPRALATDLLELSVVLVPVTGRAPLFGPPVPVPRTASPSDRLAAFLGRGRLPRGRIALSHRSPSHLLSDARRFFRV
jgi:uncharacterized protein (TIGR03083 family)